MYNLYKNRIVMKKYMAFLLVALTLAGVTTSCSEDDLSSKSNFDLETPIRTAFDEWLLDNYVAPYNIDFKYLFEYNESDNKYNLAPAELSKSIAMAKLVKFLWIDAYVEAQNFDRTFICTYGPKMIHLIGSPAYDNGMLTMGMAEGGLKVTLYNINALNPAKADVEIMNHWYFSTMHHEFSHILHQTVEFPQEFFEISSGKYTGNGWTNISDEDALKLGFITAYGSTEVHEDFAELVANYVTHDSNWWAKRLNIAGDAATYIEQKIDIVKTYLTEAWNIDLDQLRDIVQRRSEQVKFIDLTKLN